MKDNLSFTPPEVFTGSSDLGVKTVQLPPELVRGAGYSNGVQEFDLDNPRNRTEVIMAEVVKRGKSVGIDVDPQTCVANPIAEHR